MTARDRTKYDAGRKRSGPSGKVAEAQRGTEQVKLRLPPDVAATIRERSAAKGTTASGYVAELVARDETRRARDNRPKPWVERVAAGLCGKCGTDRPLATASAPCAEGAQRAQERHRAR